MVGLTVAFIFVNNEIQTYLLVGIMLASIIGITVEVWLKYNGGYEIGLNKVHPSLNEMEDNRAYQKKIYG